MPTKICNRCEQEKPLEAFHKHANCADGRLNQCRVCRNKYVSDYRMKNGGGNKVRGRSKIANKARMRRRHDRFKALVAGHKDTPCLDCGHRFPLVCMDFDHVRGEKKFNVSQAYNVAGSWQKIIDEIAKCEIVCANCHRIRTQTRLDAGY